jgi:HPt (histidine-containing phosphotransfer) domain-containing protein
LLQLFLDQVPLQVEQLDAAVAVGERDDARALAHKLKGSLLTVGAETLAEAAQAIQHAVERGQIDDAEAQLVQGVIALEKRVRSELGSPARMNKGGPW